MAYYLYNLSTGRRQPFTDRFTGTSTSSNGLSSFGTVRAIAFDASQELCVTKPIYAHLLATGKMAPWMAPSCPAKGGEGWITRDRSQRLQPHLWSGIWGLHG